MTPCRVVDTRVNTNPYPFGPPAFAAEEIRTITMTSSATCTIPAGAVAYSVNIAVIPLGPTMRWLTAWDTGSPQPHASTLTDYTGIITSNSAVVPAGTDGSINVFVKDATQVVIDINGYYTTAPPGHAYSVACTTACPQIPAFGGTTILSQPFPSGSYVINAKANINGSGASTVTCQLQLQSSGSILDQSALQGELSGVVVNAATVTLNVPDSLLLVCRVPAASPTISNATLVATQVAALN
jgi:hypothetical protein